MKATKRLNKVILFLNIFIFFMYIYIESISKKYTLMKFITKITTYKEAYMLQKYIN